MIKASRHGRPDAGFGRDDNGRPTRRQSVPPCDNPACTPSMVASGPAQRRSMPKNSISVALLADSHGRLDHRVEKIARTASIVIHAGDIGGRGILDRLGRTGARVIAVTGNTDTRRHWPEADLGVLECLPRSARVELPGGLLAVEHGDRFPARTRHARLRRAYPEAGAIVCGHSHRRVLDCSATPWILNPGACGRSRAHGGPGCLVLHASPEQWALEEFRFEPPARERTRAIR